LGEFYTQSFENSESLQKHLLAIQASEIIIDSQFVDKESIQQRIQGYTKSLCSIYHTPHDVHWFLLQQCKVQTLQSFGKALEWGRDIAMSLLLHYLHATQQQDIRVTRIHYQRPHDFVLLDDITIKNLEIFQSSYESSQKYSLFGVINTCITHAWSRLLQYCLSHPYKNPQHIAQRSQHIAYFFEQNEKRQLVSKQLKHMSDIPRLCSLFVYKKPSPVLMSKLRRSLWCVFESDVLVQELARIQADTHIIQTNKEFYWHLCTMFVDDEDLTNESWFIRQWFDSTIDELSKIAFRSDELLLDYQQELVTCSGINNIKIKYVGNQWYFVELTPKDTKQFELCFDTANEKFDFVKRQTLKWGQRYTSPYLEHMQEKILEAKQQLSAHEQKILRDLQSRIADMLHIFFDFSDYIAQIDLASSHATYAFEHNFCAPTLQTNKSTTHLLSARHPVIERFLPKDQDFIPNDLDIGHDTHIITWPNMWWKSTFLRQNALIVLMTHCGLRVPAKQANVCLVDGIFARVWSGDVIAKNQSTFMTEMIEVANILHNASSNSFVIFDELGRWTSTYDWLALTESILRYISHHIGCTTLVATHYHELIALADEITTIKNFCVWVYETDKDVIFLKKIIAWWANKSYGIDVAKLAWIPEPILVQAKQLLLWLQEDLHKNTQKSFQESSQEHMHKTPQTQKEIQQTGLFAQQTIEANSMKTNQINKDTVSKNEKIIQEIQALDINNLTPLQALQTLVLLQKKI